jgi:hypothetical protein
MWNELVSKLDGGEILGLCGMIVGLLAIIGGIGVAITKVVASHYRRTQLDEMEVALKMEMIQRGMSAADIKQVLEARTGSARRSSFQDLFAGLHTPGMPRACGKEAKRPQA